MKGFKEVTAERAGEQGRRGEAIIESIIGGRKHVEQYATRSVTGTRGTEIAVKRCLIDPEHGVLGIKGVANALQIDLRHTRRKGSTKPHTPMRANKRQRTWEESFPGENTPLYGGPADNRTHSARGEEGAENDGSAAVKGGNKPRREVRSSTSRVGQPARERRRDKRRWACSESPLPKKE
jgi:hypothetical protein